MAMQRKRWLSLTGMPLALAAGVAGGLFLVAASSPTPAFTYSQVSVVSWRGEGDSVPAGVETSGWSAPMFYTTSEEGGSPEGRLATGPWAPGDTVQRSLVVRNVDPIYMVQLDAIRVDLRGEMGLAPWFHLEVLDEVGQVLYQGRLSDFPAEAAAFLSPVLLRREGQQSLKFRVTLDPDTDQRYQGTTVVADFIITARSYAIPIMVDVHPSSWPNPINPGAPGNIPVAVNGGAELDVRTLDWTTARFGPNQVMPLRQAAFEDWNKDGQMDMILHFDNRTSGITCGMTSVILTIANNGGDVFEGSDLIVTPSCGW